MFFHITFRKFLIIIFCALALQILVLAIFARFFNIETFDQLISTQTNNKLFCEIQNQQMISALKRMKNHSCRQSAIETFCLITKNQPWPDYLENKCDLYQKNKSGKIIDCFSYHTNLSILLNKKKNSAIINSLSGSNCLELCLQIDFKYFINKTDHCICLNDFSLISSSQQKCDIECAKNFSSCVNQIFIYSTGLQKTPFYFPGLNNNQNEISVKRPKIVFLLLFSGRSLFQVFRLLKNIYSSHHYYYIHVDARDIYLYNELIYLEKKYLNMKFAKKRYSSIWGGASLLSTILSCLHSIFGYWNDWEFVINLSETDFPIKKITELEIYLEKNIGKNFLKSHGKSTESFIKTQALNKVFFECEERMWRIADKNLIKGLVWDGGSDWFVLSRNFSHFVLYSEEHTLNNLKSFFSYSLLPAESFFHVSLRNSELCKSIVNNNLRVTNWNRKKGCKCQHKHVVDWCGCSPNVFRITDVPKLLSTRNKPLFFARKFEHVVDSNIIDFIEQKFLYNSLSSIQNFKDTNFYSQNVFHSKYDNESLLEYKFDFYDFFVNQSFHLYRSCSKSLFNYTESIILESNVIMKNSNFFGTVLKIGNNDIIMELMLKRFSNDTIFPKNNLVPKPLNFQVCSHFDLKEEIFRDFECLIDQKTSFQVLHVWEPFFGVYRVWFVFLDPDNRISSSHEIILNNTKSNQASSIKLLFTYDLINNILKSGWWKLIILNQNTMIAAHKFFIIPDKKLPFISSNNLHDLRLENFIFSIINDWSSFFKFNSNFSFDQVWYIDQICLINKVSPECPAFKNCDNFEWSSIALKSHFSL